MMWWSKSNWPVVSKPVIVEFNEDRGWGHMKDLKLVLFQGICKMKLVEDYNHWDISKLGK